MRRGAGLFEDGEGGERREQADHAGDEHQPEIMLLGNAAVDAQHGDSIGVDGDGAQHWSVAYGKGGKNGVKGS